MQTRELSQLNRERDKTVVTQVERKEIHFTQLRRNTLKIITAVERGGGGKKRERERERKRERRRRSITQHVATQLNHKINHDYETRLNKLKVNRVYFEIIKRDQ